MARHPSRYRLAATVAILATVAVFLCWRSTEPLPTPNLSMQDEPAPQESALAAPPSPAMSMAAPLASSHQHPFHYLPESQRADGSFTLQWDPAVANALRAGDTFTIDLPMGRSSYTAQVNEAINVPGGRRLAGRMHDGDIDSWPFSLTLMDAGRVVVGNFSANERQFSIQTGPAGTRLRDTTSESEQLIDSEQAHAGYAH